MSESKTKKERICRCCTEVIEGTAEEMRKHGETCALREKAVVIPPIGGVDGVLERMGAPAEDAPLRTTVEPIGIEGGESRRRSTLGTPLA